MHTKTAALALFALVVASNAAPLPNRLSQSYARADRAAGLARRGSPDCNDESATYGLDSGKTENDCANTQNATGFKAESLTAVCSIPVKGSGKTGICYLGGASAQRRSPQDDPEAASAPEDGGGAGGSGETSEEPGEKPSKAAEEKKPEEPTDQQPASSETPEGQPGAEQPPSPETPPQTPVKAPALVGSSTKSAAPSATPPVTTNTPGITPPRPNGTPGKNNNGTQPDNMAWLGNSLFKIFGGLF